MGEKSVPVTGGCLCGAARPTASPSSNQRCRAVAATGIRFRLGRWSLLAPLLLAAAGTQAHALVERTELARTWDQAGVQIELTDTGYRAFGRMGDDRLHERLAVMPAGTRLPTIIYVHGCNGLDWGRGASLFGRLRRAGYALIAPDSFARHHRPRMCHAQDEWTDAIRLGEIRHAAEQARWLPWVDADNLFLIGHSEGAMYVAAYEGDEFKARVAAANTCSRGVNGAETSPLLVTWSDHDRRRGPRDLCDDATERLVIEGTAHWVLTQPEVRRAVQAFLTRHTTGDQLAGSNGTDE